MPKDLKKFIIPSITLALVASGSAALIGVTNFFTKDPIAQNEKKRIRAGIVEIFNEDVQILEEKEINDSTLKYTNYEYTLNEGVAFRTTGTNSYGKISMLVGYLAGLLPGGDDTIVYRFCGVYMIINEQSFASTLVDNYVTPLNNEEINYDDVKCGATVGATLIKNMIDETNKIMKERAK